MQFSSGDFCRRDQLILVIYQTLSLVSNISWVHSVEILACKIVCSSCTFILLSYLMLRYLLVQLLCSFILNKCFICKIQLVLIECVVGFLDSNSEDSDTDISDVGDLDSDLEQEKQVRYDREVYREDAAELRKLEKGVTAGRKRKHGPSSSLKLEWVHG